MLFQCCFANTRLSLLGLKFISVFAWKVGALFLVPIWHNLNFYGKKKKYVKRKKERKQGAGLSFIKPHKGMVKTLKQNRIFLNFSSNVYTLKSEVEEDNYKKKILISFVGTANECNFFTNILVKLKSFCANLIICAKFEISTRQPLCTVNQFLNFPI